MRFLVKRINDWEQKSIFCSINFVDKNNNFVSQIKKDISSLLSVSLAATQYNFKE